MIEVEDNSTAAFNLWCSTVTGTASVADDKISLSRDAGLLALLSQVTGGRCNGDRIGFPGTTTLHFRLMTN